MHCCQSCWRTLKGRRKDFFMGVGAFPDMIEMYWKENDVQLLCFTWFTWLLNIVNNKCITDGSNMSHMRHTFLDLTEISWQLLVHFHVILCIHLWMNPFEFSDSITKLKVLLSGEMSTFLLNNNFYKILYIQDIYGSDAMKAIAVILWPFCFTPLWDGHLLLP